MEDTNREQEVLVSNIIAQVQDILLSYMMFGTKKYDDLTVAKFRDMLNTNTQKVLDKLEPGVGMQKAFAHVIGEEMAAQIFSDKK
jgi:hypothetical protein